MQISALEKELQTLLLVRNTRGVSLTPAGVTFLKHVNRVFAVLDEASRSVQSFSLSAPEEIRIGVTPTLGRALLDDLMLGAAASQPAFRLSMIEALSEELLVRLKAREVTCAFCYDVKASRTWLSVPVFTEDLFLVGSPVLITRSRVKMNEMTRFPLALGPPNSGSRIVIEQAATNAGIALDVRSEIVPSGLKRELLIRKALGTIVPYGLFLPDIERSVLRAASISPPISRTMHFVILRSVAPQIREQLIALSRAAIAKQLVGSLGWRKPR
jgi:LysR family nitrogen assimilation transcriptional regulator